MRQVAEKEGATYIEPSGPWESFTVTDDRIVTGVNPQSAEKITEATIAAFEAK